MKMGFDFLKDKFIEGDEAKVDEQGRFILPIQFKKVLIEYYSPQLYLCCLDNEKIDMYPMSVYEKLVKDILKLKEFDPVRRDFIRKLLDGKVITLDSRGRVAIPPHLRQRVGIGEKVKIVSQITFLELWDLEHYKQKEENAPISDEQLRILNDKLYQLERRDGGT